MKDDDGNVKEENVIKIETKPLRRVTRGMTRSRTSMGNTKTQAEGSGHGENAQPQPEKPAEPASAEADGRKSLKRTRSQSFPMAQKPAPKRQKRQHNPMAPVAINVSKDTTKVQVTQRPIEIVEPKQEEATESDREVPTEPETTSEAVEPDPPGPDLHSQPPVIAEPLPVAAFPQAQSQNQDLKESSAPPPTTGARRCKGAPPPVRSKSLNDAGDMDEGEIVLIKWEAVMGDLRRLGKSTKRGATVRDCRDALQNMDPDAEIVDSTLDGILVRKSGKTTGENTANQSSLMSRSGTASANVERLEESSAGLGADDASERSGASTGGCVLM